MTRATIIVETRHLDTDARIRDAHEVVAPENAGQERLRLVELVSDLHPGAIPRSYADGAATFLGREHLIVAFYEARDLLGSIRAGALERKSHAPQVRLFEP